MKKTKKPKRVEIIKTNKDRHMVLTPEFRVSFPQLFEPRAYEEGQKKVFQLDMIFDDEDAFKEVYKGKKTKTVSMKQAIRNAKVDQWGEDKNEWPNFPNEVFKDGDERTNAEGEIYMGYEGKFYVTAKSNEEFKPKLIDKYGKAITEPDDLYGGCYARAQLIARPYVSGKTHGVSFKLLQVMKTRDGEKFGGMDGDVFDVEDAIEGEGDEDSWDY